MRYLIVENIWIYRKYDGMFDNVNNHILFNPREYLYFDVDSV